MTQINLSIKQKQTYKTDLWLPRGKGSEGGIGHMGLTDINWYTWNGQTARSYSTAQYPVINHNGKEYEKECIHVYTDI